MIRPTLLKPVRARRPGQRRLPARGAGAPAPPWQADAQAPRRREAPAPADPAVQRAREAGGPTDRAAYACPCGYLFVAPVSTTVDCPHCRATQAW